MVDVASVAGRPAARALACLLVLGLPLAACQPPAPPLAERLADPQVDAPPAPAPTDRNLTDLLSAIAESAAHGLNPADYQAARLTSLAGTTEGRALMRTMAVQLARDLTHGRVAPRRVDPAWHIVDPDPDPAMAVDAALAQHRLGAVLQAMVPASPEYQMLTTALRALQATPPPATEAATADPAAKAATADPAAKAATADPAAKAATLDPAERARIITRLRATLERWRWLPRTLPATRLWVNQPEYRVFLWRDGSVVRAHDVVIGMAKHPTPSFSVDVTGVIFNPWWDPPARLVRESVIPALRRGQGARLDYRLYANNAPVPLGTLNWKALSSLPAGYRLRQAPGPANALGQVKLRMYNPYDVYLHDTPHKELFDRPMRALSNGCVRTRDAVALAQALLTGIDGWDAARVAAVLTSRRETAVGLKQPVPAYLVYMTAAVRDGAVVTWDDVYGRDAAVAAALDAPRDIAAAAALPAQAAVPPDDGLSRCAV